MSFFTGYTAWPINGSNQTGAGSDTTIATDDSTHVLTGGSTFTVSGAVGGLLNGTYTYQGTASAMFVGIGNSSNGFYAQDPQNHGVYFTSQAAGAGETVDESSGGSFDLADPPPPCFALGSRLAAPDGEIAVEDLRTGDALLTAAGEAKPVVWIGRSQVDCRRHPNADSVRPVRVRAGAFAPDVPKRDLVLSPGHAVFAEGALVPVCHLINGVSIVREEHATTVTYYHVELPAHDVLLAEGLPAESYLDDGNRRAFDNAGCRVLYPDHTPRNWDAACAPKCEGGEQLAVVKRRLRTRLEQCGYRLEGTGQVAVFAAGRRLAPRFAAGGLLHFLLPRGVERVRLVSPHGIPAAVLDDSDDTRRLGARIALVSLDGEWVQLDSPVLAEGFHAPEHDSAGSWRWTDGDARLQVPRTDAPRLLALFVRDVMRHWIAAQQPAPFAAAA